MFLCDNHYVRVRIRRIRNVRFREIWYALFSNFERFQYFNIEANFLKNKDFFKKIEYRFII